MDSDLDSPGTHHGLSFIALNFFFQIYGFSFILMPKKFLNVKQGWSLLSKRKCTLREQEHRAGMEIGMPSSQYWDYLLYVAKYGLNIIFLYMCISWFQYHLIKRLFYHLHYIYLHVKNQLYTYMSISGLFYSIPWMRFPVLISWIMLNDLSSCIS